MHHKITSYSLFASCVAALGGLLFGYNISVISGVLLFAAKEFHLSTVEQEIIVSTLLIGALLGALFGGLLADQFGRKKTLFITLFLFFAGVLYLTDADGFGSLLFGRFMTGLAIGIVSMAAPLYIAEISPAESRGALVSLNQLFITIGIFIAYIVTFSLSDQEAWRAMFSFAFIPIGIQLVGLFFIPETPAWLNREVSQSSTNWRALFDPQVRKPFLIGIGISIFQAITGINTVIFYAPQIFLHAGFGTARTALLATVLVGGVNVAVTVIALWLIDRVGRRPLLIWGLSGMAISLIVLGFSSGMVSLAALLGYIICFAFSLGPVAWLMISEIYPLGIRGRAMGISTFSNWLSNYFVSLTFLSLLETFGTGGTFWLYAFICFLALWFVINLVPETKGKTFEQIQSFWKKP